MLIVWDLLFFLFVICPFLLGGFWFRKEKLFFEITQPGPFLAVLAVVLYLHVRKTGATWKDSKILPRLQSLWDWWRHRLLSRSLPTLTLSAALAGLLWFFISVRRHAAFQSGAADLGIFTNTAWNLSHGYGYFSSLKGGVNLLTDHQSYLFLLFGPVFALFPHPHTLLLLQALGVAAGAIPLYYIARQYSDEDDSFPALVPLLYWIYLPLRNAVRFDFHPEIFLLPLALGGIAGLQSRRKRFRILGVLAFLLAAGAKESAGPVLAGIGAAWLFGAGPRQSRLFTGITGALLAAFGLFIFYFDLSVLPRLMHYNYSYASAYSHLGGSTEDILLSPITRPALLLKSLFALNRLKFLFALLAPFALLPLSSAAFIAAIPGLLMLFLTDGAQRVTTGFHYAVEPAVGVFWALAALNAKPWIRARRKHVLLWLGLCSVLLMGRSDTFYLRFFSATPAHAWLREEALPKLSPEKSVAASSALVPHLSTRRWIQFLPNLSTPFAQGLADCVVIDLSVNNTPMGERDWAELQSRLNTYYIEETACGGFRVYRRPDLRSCLREGVECLH